MDFDDAYDIEAVEAQLARMQRQRERRRLDSRTEAPRFVMELTEVGLSSGTDSDEDDSSPAKPVHSAVRKPKSRLADSLDLSMSVGDFSALAAPASASSVHEVRQPKVIGAMLQHETSTKVTLPHTSTQLHAPPPPGITAVSSLKPPERIQLSAYRNGGLAAPRATRLTADSPASAHTAVRSVPVRCGVGTTPVDQAAPVRTGLETRPTAEQQRPAKPRDGTQDRIQQHRSEPEVGSSDDDDDEDPDEDLVSAEEERLRQSLAKLDNRLTKLTTTKLRVHSSSCNNNNVAAVREGYSVAGLDNSALLKRNATATVSERPAQVFATSTATSKRVAGEIHSPAGADDDSIVANAAYGGGAHCKRGQLTSTVERSSSARRAEMSSGMHKLRVRTGGATAQESAGADRDSGKHKVVVKRDLAHLLF